jgi:hypothetical protein
VKILYDERWFGHTSLFSESLDLFQGPSLCVYNSGLFEENDFESLRRLGSCLTY